MKTLGILVLDTDFARIPGDVGCPETFAFPVRYFRVRGANVARIVHQRDRACLPPFVDGARALVAAGCAGLATTCGFLVRWQRELAAAAGVPVATSALLQLPTVSALLPDDLVPGVLTYSAADLSTGDLVAAGGRPDVPVEGIDPRSHFADVIEGRTSRLDPDRMARDVLSAAERLLTRHRRIGALVLECANMPPYAPALRSRFGLPVFDALTLLHAFYSALPRPPERP